MAILPPGAKPFSRAFEVWKQALNAWEVLTAEDWETGQIGDWLSGPDAVTRDRRASAERLQPLVADMLGVTSPIRLVPSEFTIEGVGEKGSPSFRPGPWTYPLFEVVALTPAAGPEPTPSEAV